MALYIPQSILHLARSLYVRLETYGPTYVIKYFSFFLVFFNSPPDVDFGIAYISIFNGRVYVEIFGYQYKIVS